MNKQSGFTLIELVMVIVILGILAATAIPRFVNLSAEAGNAAAQGVGGALAAGSAINFATCSTNVAHPSCIAADVATGDDCVNLQPTIQGFDAALFTIDGTIPTCNVTRTGGGAATVTVVPYP